MEWIDKFIMLWRSPDRAKRGVARQAVLEAKKSLISRLPGVVHAGTRAYCKKDTLEGSPVLKKVFADNEVAKACMTREMAAREIFSGRSWMVSIAGTSGSCLFFPLLPKECRLDKIAPSLSDEVKNEIAVQSLAIALEIFLEGLAHRDFHAKNIFWVDGQLHLVDFEVLHPYIEGNAPPFPESYDITGEGLESPFETQNMCYVSDSPYSLKNVLDVPLCAALSGLEQKIKENLRDASLTFKKRGKRHICQAQRIYNSLALPFFTVDPREAQRNCGLRFEAFGISGEDISGKRLLDLGSNIGGMIFEAQRLGPTESVGVEYDADKVDVARMMAAYNGLNNIGFVEADIDELEPAHIGGPFDVVFCLAIEAHVRKKQRLFELLVELTGEKLYFEGNASTDAVEAREALLSAGFSEVRMLGMCNDDYLDENNNRPLLVAIR